MPCCKRDDALDVAALLFWCSIRNMDKFEVRDDLPPPASKPVGKGYKQAVLSLKVGQSVLLPTTYASGRSLVAGCYAHHRIKRGSFRVRPDGSGVRIWRVTPETG